MAEKKARKVEPKPKRKTGRKELYHELDIPSKLEAITGWARQGMIDKEIAAALGVSRELIYKWKRLYPEFAEALKQGKFEADGELIAKSFRNAVGHYVYEQEGFKVRTVKPITVEYPNGRKKTTLEEVEEVQIVELRKFVPGNAALAIFMLKNRLPEHYKDKIEANLDVKNQVVFVDNVPVTDDDEVTDGDKPGVVQ